MVGAAIQTALIRGLAAAAQYIVPGLCLAAAAMSGWQRQRRKSLLRSVEQAGHPGTLNGMGWEEFEILVGEAYRQQGFRIVELGGAGPDGGVDLVLTKGSEKFLVQCKQWKAYKVGVSTVRELYGVMAASGATGGFVVTSGSFSADAKEFAKGRNVELVDGPQLHNMIRRAKEAQARSASAKEGVKPTQSAETTSAPPKVGPLPSAKPAGLATDCPRCGAAMVLRTSRQGANAGGAFWGCSTFPKYRGTRPAP